MFATVISIKVQFLSSVGGKKSADVTRNILTRTFSNNYARELSFSGKGNNKLKFKNLKIHEIINSKI